MSQPQDTMTTDTLLNGRCRVCGMRASWGCGHERHHVEERRKHLSEPEHVAGECGCYVQRAGYIPYHSPGDAQLAFANLCEQQERREHRDVAEAVPPLDISEINKYRRVLGWPDIPEKPDVDIDYTDPAWELFDPLPPETRPYCVSVAEIHNTTMMVYAANEEEAARLAKEDYQRGDAEIIDTEYDRLHPDTEWYVTEG